MRLGDQAHDPRQRGLLANRDHADPQAAADGDRPCHDSNAPLLGNRARLARDHRLVDVGGAVDDLSIRRHPGARADEDHIAHEERAQRHLLRTRIRDALGAVGMEKRLNSM